MKKFIPVLKNSKLFSGVSEEEIGRAYLQTNYTGKAYFLSFGGSEKKWQRKLCYSVQ